MKNFSTLAELIVYQSSNFNNPRAFNFLGQSFSNQEFLQKIFHFACALKELGFKKNQTLANCLQSSPSWLIIDLGTILVGGITVPIFNNISKENFDYEIKDAAVEFIFEQRGQTPFLTKGSDPFSLDDLILLGEKAVLEKKYNLDEMVKDISPDDLATIIYTSGSTGTPKGVELTHRNLVSQIVATAKVFPLDSVNDKALSFLPLAHIFERMVMMFYMTQGIEIYFADDVKNIGNLLKEVRPTLMTSVPRMLEKVFIKIKDGAANKKFIAKYLARTAVKRALVKDIKIHNIFDKIFDVLVYKKFRDALGGKMRMIICGGSALSEDMERFYCNIGVNLFCGYGLTESSPVLAVNHPKAHKFGTVGQAFDGVELKIAVDLELLARGENIMRGYHNSPKKTAEVVVDGWLKTGDLARIDEEGFVKIIGRKKELFKNANGKYVSPIPLEQKLTQELGFLLGAIVVAEGRKFTSALLFPDFDILEKFKIKFNFSGSDKEFLQSNFLKNFVQQKIDKINNSLNHWEQIQKFYIACEPISIKSGEITPSMKLKRKVLEEKYKTEIENFYL